MAWISASALFTLFLALAMLCTGTINTIATAMQDKTQTKAFNIDPPQGFSHPFFQSACMFIGEMLCLLVFGAMSLRSSGLFSRCSKKQYTSSDIDVVDISSGPKKTRINPLWLAIPAMCDLGGSTLLNFALLLTSPSVYQMLRGILVVFTGLFSIIFLKARLYPHHWAGLVLIVAGACVVGSSSIIYPTTGAQQLKNPLLGDVLVVAAQVVAAVQFIVEEKLLSKYDVEPLECVGYEGLWGFLMTVVVLVISMFVKGSDYGVFENSFAAFSQMGQSGALTGSVIGSILSIAFFNFFGISITKRISSTTRSTIDSCRTLFVWVVSLLLGWEVFHWLEVGGFVILVTGTFLYNEVIKIPRYQQWYLAKKEARRLELEAQEIDGTFEKKPLIISTHEEHGLLSSFTDKTM